MIGDNGDNGDERREPLHSDVRQRVVGNVLAKVGVVHEDIADDLDELAYHDQPCVPAQLPIHRQSTSMITRPHTTMLSSTPSSSLGVV